MTQRLSTIFARISAPEPKAPWGFLDVTNSLSAALIALFLIGPYAALAVFGGSPFVLAPLVGWSLGCALTLAYVWFIQGRRPDYRAALRLGAPGLPASFTLLLGVGAAILLDLIGLGVTRHFLTAPELANANAYDVSGWAAALALMVVMQPLAEEVVFRGVALPKLRDWLGAWVGLVMCAMLYAVFHVLVYPPAAPQAFAYWYALVLPFLAGLVFGAARAYTGSTRTAILMHAAFGLFAVLKAFTLAG